MARPWFCKLHSHHILFFLVRIANSSVMPLPLNSASLSWLSRFPAVHPFLCFFLFLKWTIFKVFIEFVIIFAFVLCFGFWTTSCVESYLADRGSDSLRLHWDVRTQPYRTPREGPIPAFIYTCLNTQYYLLLCISEGWYSLVFAGFVFQLDQKRFNCSSLLALHHT